MFDDGTFEPTSSQRTERPTERPLSDRATAERPLFADILKQKRTDDTDTPNKQRTVDDWATAALTLIATAGQAEKDHQNWITQLTALVKDMLQNSPLAYIESTINQLLLQHMDDKQGAEKVRRAMKDVIDRLDKT
jgi:hypothetical protein